MDIFDVLTLIGGLCLFLFGMNLMGGALERSAGSKLELMIGKLTTGKLAGLLTGLGVTAVIQSSSATTVMVVGFVNSRLMNLKQAIHVIMGANIGTTVTAWILSLSGISGSNMFLKLLKPSSFTPILALIGIVLFMFTKSNKKKDIGMVLLGFATLMFGMETCLPGTVYYVQEPHSWCSCRRYSYRYYSVQLCLSWYFAGTCGNGCRFLRCGDPDHYGTEYRHLCYRNDLFCRYNKKC